MTEFEAATVRADLDAYHQLHRRTGVEAFTRWIAATATNAAHPDVRRITPVDSSTLVVSRWSGGVHLVALDEAVACSWCDGIGWGDASQLYPPPCAACLGSGLAAGQRGHPAAPHGWGVRAARNG